MISQFHAQIKRLLRRLLGEFVQVKAITDTGEDITHVLFEDAKFQLNNQLIALGLETRDYISKHEDAIEPRTIERFYMFEVLLVYS